MSKEIIGEIIGWILISGTILSYIPQYYRIYDRKTSKGISEWMLIFGGFSCIYNILGTYESKREKITECNYCYRLVLPLMQLVTPWLCGLIFYFMFIKYYTCGVSKKMIKVRVIIFVIVNGISILFVVIWNIKKTDFNDGFLPDILSIISSIFSIIMWIPQILKTHLTGEQGSLSVISLLIHATGCLITVIYQCYFNDISIIDIASYIIGFILEMYIVVICIYYYKKNRNYFKKFKELNDTILNTTL